ncbi:MAG: DUF5610 domain-containing protein [Gammaproteobacteria bacterium]|nr:DUF5610 domain-containing protein [Gammaproteobacteria bacterium]
MDINTNTFSQNVHDHAKADDKKDDSTTGQVISEIAQAKKQMNASILESSVNVNISVGNDSLSLVLKTALENINEALQESTGEANSIQSAYDAGVDVSPEVTASRIVSLSTGFFNRYQQNHPEMEQDEALTSFVEIIQKGVDTGFGEAREILSGLDVLEGDIANNINQTYELVQQKLELFLDSAKEAQTTSEIGG